ncbi:MAG: ACP S-malonyltransferase [Acidobacteria bacterium]|nr:ACP S-malonyltransferase [Acidobacteriota bacterium]
MNTGFVFPGQGSQHVGMGQAAAAEFPEAAAAFEEADDALGFSLSALCFGGDEEELRRTENTQPAILTVSVALHRVLQARGAAATCMAGHSLGEYSALVAAGSLDLATAVRLVRARGQYMQSAVPEGQGSMAAVLGLEDGVVEEVCAAAAEGEVISAANYNAPGQVVIAGAVAAVERAVDLAKERGARRAMLLNVSAPFHCELMAPAAAELDARLAEVQFEDPAVPVMCNVDSVPLTRAADLQSALRRQVTAPVRWVANLAAMLGHGTEQLVEIGPGRVLTGLAKRAAKGTPALAVQGPDDVASYIAVE